ncbi:hypothetical protein Q8A67_020803 [Cirrhinus molitorella]|uniref:Uncharacterized protein n=1 Tax=Cirrhinus molitorella TaxID=172907 RepID=A0AA88P9E7_9TELE|nr:hypothetical protein Q8A67_020803 [Cirrhinus molitorella]
MEQMPEQDSTTDFAKKRGKQKRLSLDEYAASLLQMEQMPGQDSTTDFAKKRGKQKRLSLDEYAASLLQWLPSGIAASRAFQKTALAAVGFEPTPPKRLEP